MFWKQLYIQISFILNLILLTLVMVRMVVRKPSKIFFQPYLSTSDYSFICNKISKKRRYFRYFASLEDDGAK